MNRRNRQDWPESPEEQAQLAERVTAAAEKGGASEEDIQGLYYLLGKLWGAEEVAVPLARQRAGQLAAIERRNAGRRITPQQRAQAKALDAELVADFPKPTPRHDEIDRRLGWPRGRARRALVEPRRSKR